MSIQKKKTEDKYVLAFDPGGTTGMCLLRVTEKDVYLTVLAQIEDGHMGFYDNLVGVPAGLGTPTTLVSEKWVEHGVKGADRTPLVIEGIQYAFWPDQMIYQTPDMKQMIPDELLKEIGVWTPGQPHQMDALRHALIFLRNSGNEAVQRMLADGTPMKQDGDGDDDGEKCPGCGQSQDQGEHEGQTTPAGDKIGECQPQHSLSILLPEPESPDYDEDELDGLAAEAAKVYKRERDVDGAFSGFQPDPTAEATVLIDEDF